MVDPGAGRGIDPDGTAGALDGFHDGVRPDGASVNPDGTPPDDTPPHGVRLGVSEPGGAYVGVNVSMYAGGQAHDDPPADGANPVGTDTAEDASARTRVKKAPNAFRTISEVADDLHIPQHVLRFWETKFPQVKPMKRGGGRRYYRPDDIALLRRISDLLYIQGYTIKGVQRLLREGGGRLSEDIPPAQDEERAKAEAELGGMHDDHAELLIPGLELSPEPPPPAPPKLVARRRLDPEAERLRAVLIETLAELEAIRALLR
jgi:DNA-binding transcriptional MerR regulator